MSNTSLIMFEFWCYISFHFSSSYTSMNILFNSKQNNFFTVSTFLDVIVMWKFLYGALIRALCLGEGKVEEG